jgi:four helix bundle protein
VKSEMKNGLAPQDIRERSFCFAMRIVKLCQSLNAKPGVTRILANQLLRSGTSIGANIEEAYGSQSKADFIAKMSISCKEARETHYWLRLLIATDIIGEIKLAELTDESNQLVAILTSIVKNSRRANSVDKKVKAE